MEADWSVEIGADLPHIFVPWEGYRTGSERDASSGENAGRTNLAGDDLSQGNDQAGPNLRFIDLRGNPAAIESLDEPRRYPVLKRALTALNSTGSPVFTSKCDVFPLAKEEIDPLELDASPECSSGLSCYIDLSMRDCSTFASFSVHEVWLRQVVERLRRSAQVRSARADFVLRPATVFAREGFAVTLYVAACGRDISAALSAWEAALDAVLDALGVPAGGPQHSCSNPADPTISGD